MIAEAIQAIKDLANAEHNRKRFDENEVGTVAVDKDGSATPVVQQASTRADVDDLASLVRGIKAYAGPESTVWVSENAVIAVLDDIDEWPGYRLPNNDGSAYILPTHDIDKITLGVSMNGLLERSSWPLKVNQPAFLQKLSYDFASAKFDVELKSIVRTIRWATHDEAHQDIKQGSDAMGRSVRNEASGAADFPEYVNIDIKAFEAPVLERVAVTVEAQFIVDTAGRTLGLLPLPGELERAKRDALNKLRFEMITTLNGDWEKRIYLGSPGV